MTGIIPINKPSGFTSHDVVAKMRRILGVKRIGHAGTLDPMATGVLILLVGKATRLSDILMGSDKTYRAVLKLGLTTSTQDITGKVLESRPVTVKTEDLLSLLPRFTGRLLQLPPMYSALKVDGQTLYKMARKGKQVERTPRPVTIHTINLQQANEQEGEYTLDITCSKGTYIRTLCADIGDALGCGGTLFSLERMNACGFSIEDCVTLDECERLSNMSQAHSMLVKPDACLMKYPSVYLNDRLSTLFKNGVFLGFHQVNLTKEEENEIFRVYTTGGDLLALGIADRENETFKVYRSLY